ncbi:MAG: HAMP domain-containing histidine kinase [Candidatus Peribacter sp.]|jgi:signal transduction histidine kinase|nr:HAMP domain-containing histidine kinase [Candidatus Peribacter sp.]MBT4393011.1 HAMP domain-containing histidine kinase [Candidatus Peribacter sp.]MBT4601071.1 HAMP domain-containing histidine kinase [Candidatus Peribacter sp.]MBT5149567.1 HAMP domain-containing histidine kinase [Candidatus Peribacter sp.]MBT5637441.1 HAMP domain-containing histidine kinase [Candidatus Peribacter sp.]
MKQRKPIKFLGPMIVVVAILITTSTSWLLYNHTVNLLTDNLRKRLLAIVTTAVVEIRAEDVNELMVEEDWLKPEWERVINKLYRVKENNQDIVFMYIFRKDPSNPNEMDFVADANSINPYANLDDDPTNDVDVDNNGIIDDIDYLQWPGQEYPEPPIETFESYDGPTTSRELYEDAWGKVITGYAPIIDADGNTVAVLAADIQAGDFFIITRQTLLPFLTFIGALIFIILILFSTTIHIWNRRISLMAELDKQKDELLSIVSHQLATPVSSTKWYLEMMLDGDFGKLSGEQEKHVKSMQGVIGNLADLVSMILDVSRIQLGRMKVDLADLDLSEAINEILVVIKPKALERKAKLNVSLPKNLPVAKLDKRLVRMTLENLLSNAVKYSDKDAGEVEFNVEIVNGKLKYFVKDNGCGIPESEQGKIFGKLFRASNVQSIDGNGFGLYAAKGATEALGGTIRFESKENNGTTFFVEIPLIKETPSKA